MTIIVRIIAALLGAAAVGAIIGLFDYRDWEGDHWGEPYGVDWTVEVDDDTVSRIGKKRAGRLLDGVEHNGFPT